MNGTTTLPPSGLTSPPRGGLGAGGSDNGKLGLRADCSPAHYAALLLDPDGNNVEAACLT